MKIIINLKDKTKPWIVYYMRKNVLLHALYLWFLTGFRWFCAGLIIIGLHLGIHVTVLTPQPMSANDIDLCCPFPSVGISLTVSSFLSAADV